MSWASRSKLAFIGAGLADRLLDREQRIATRKHHSSSPAGDATFEHSHSEIRLEIAAAFCAEPGILHNAVALLVGAHRIERLLRDAHREAGNLFYAVGLVVADRQLNRLALRIDRIDHDEIGTPLEARM